MIHTLNRITCLVHWWTRPATPLHCSYKVWKLISIFSSVCLEYSPFLNWVRTTRCNRISTADPAPTRYSTGRYERVKCTWSDKSVLRYILVLERLHTTTCQCRFAVRIVMHSVCMASWQCLELCAHKELKIAMLVIMLCMLLYLMLLLCVAVDWYRVKIQTTVAYG